MFSFYLSFLKNIFSLLDYIYLDHAGTTLYSETQLKTIMNDYSSNLYGNPHSQNSSSQLTTKKIKQVREMILSFFNTSSKDYSVIFTSSCTLALKLLGESFPWSKESTFLYHLDNHNSVLGIREYAIHNQASIQLIKTPLHQIQDFEIPSVNSSKKANHLVAIPLESNFSGIKLPLFVLAEFQKKGWKVAVDAAAFVSHSSFDLKAYPVDFVAISFNKIFGFPTGLGGLIVRKEISPILHKLYFGGGTVSISLSEERFHRLRPNISEKFEDGTVNFLNIIALQHGFEWLQKLKFENITKHTHSLTQYLYKQLNLLQHKNGKKIFEIYGNHEINDPTKQGPILTFSMLHSDGTYVGYNEVEQLATLENIQLRTGCFCNPGACHSYLQLSKQEVLNNYLSGHVCWDNKDLIRGKPTGAIRISLGYMSTLNDANTFINFVKKYFLDDVKEVSNNSASASKKQSDIESNANILELENFDLELDAIYVYPIKSCGRMEVSSWEVSKYGLLYDREWTLIDDQGSYLNQKTLPAMSLIRPSINLETQNMEVSAPNVPSISISLKNNPEDIIELTVCGDRCIGLKYSEEVNQWFSSVLNYNCTLVRIGNNFADRFSGGRNLRHQEMNGITNQTLAPEAKNHCPIAFPNESQFLIISQASIEDLQSRIPHYDSQSASAINFRPNLVIRGGKPYQEDYWQEVTIGDCHFQITDSCNRCKMICIDQQTGILGREPLLTLASYRRTKGKILMGVHAVATSSSRLESSANQLEEERATRINSSSSLSSLELGKADSSKSNLQSSNNLKPILLQTGTKLSFLKIKKNE